MGRRIGAFAVDVLLVLVLAGTAGAIVWFSSATRIEAAGRNFCDQINDTYPDFDDPIVETYDVGYTCLQVNSDAYVASNDDTGRAFGVGILLALLIPLDLFLVQGLTGASVGKHIFGLRVVRDTGKIAGFGWNALRTLLLLFATFACGVVLLPAELIVASVTKRHQRVGDMAAGTYVVRKTSVGVPIVGAPASFAAAPAPGWGTASSPPPQSTWGSPTPAPTWGTAPPTAPSTEPAAPQAPPAQVAPMSSHESTAPLEMPPAENPAAPVGAPSLEPEATSPVVQLPSVGEAPATEAPTEAAAPMPALPPGAEMRWDERWNAWLYWDPASRRWLRHDPATNQWIAL